MRLTISLLTTLFLFTPLIFSDQNMKNLALSVEGIEKFEIDRGAGSLRVRGDKNLLEIRVFAEVAVEGISDESKAKKFFQDKIKLFLEKIAKKAILVCKTKKPFPFLSFRQAEVSLSVLVPEKINLNIIDGSGSMTIENTAGKVDIKNGSGKIRVENILGDVEIQRSSGELVVKDISGDVFIADCSGPISIKNIRGNVAVSPASGSIDIDGVEREVSLKRGGKGRIELRNIKGKVIKH
jgi:hypothetical protein